jgi:HK97 gp10 family phage protein
MMKIELKVTGLDNVLDMLNNFPKEVVSVRGGPVKTALKRAAQVIRKEVAKNLENNISDEATGLLAKSLIATRGKTNGKGEKYVVRFKNLKYTRSSGEVVTTRKTAHIFEYGSSKQKPRPFIRPAAQAKAQEAVNVFSKELNKEIDKLTKKYILRTGK